MSSESTQQVGMKLAWAVLVLVFLLVMVSRYRNLGSQLKRISQETHRIQVLAEQLQGMQPTEIRLPRQSDPIREDLIPYAARNAGLRASAVTRVRPEYEGKYENGLSIDRTRVFLERVEISKLFKMLFEIEKVDNRVVVGDLTAEYSDTTRLWRAEFTVTRTVLKNANAD